MIATVRTTTPAPAATTPPPATDPALQQRFTELATTLESADGTLSSMVTGHNPVGTGWGPFMSELASKLQGARDELLVAKPDARAELGAKLGGDVLHLAEAAGSLSVMAKNRSGLSE